MKLVDLDFTPDPLMDALHTTNRMARMVFTARAARINKVGTSYLTSLRLGNLDTYRTRTLGTFEAKPSSLISMHYVPPCQVDL